MDVLILGFFLNLVEGRFENVNVLEDFVLPF